MLSGSDQTSLLRWPEESAGRLPRQQLAAGTLIEVFGCNTREGRDFGA
jgi:hypothetical protein